jgi:predicted ribosomally synthesized peptide with nif11-like leader
MSSESLSAFLTRAATDPALQAQIKGITNAETVVQIASEHGFEINADELADFLAKAEQELSDQDLEEVAGGRAALNNDDLTGIKVGPTAFLGCGGGTHAG